MGSTALATQNRSSALLWQEGGWYFGSMGRANSCPAYLAERGRRSTGNFEPAAALSVDSDRQT